MKKTLIILSLLFSNIAYGVETDIYFGNGIKTSKKEAKYNANFLNKKLGLPKGKVKIAYNHTYDLLGVDGGFDLTESLTQKFSLQTLKDNFWYKKGKITAHKFDLDKQLKAYRDSISSGKKVLVVAHSQGNLFANDAYNALNDEGLGDKFDAVSIASPMFSSIKSDTKNFSWDNDIVADLALNPVRKRYYNIVRKVKWLDIHPSVHSKMPINDYEYKNYIDNNSYKLILHKWRIGEPSLYWQSNSLVHSFRFYLGEALEDNGVIKYGFFSKTTLHTDRLKDKILKEINRIIAGNTLIPNDNNTDNGNGGGNTSENSGNGSSGNSAENNGNNSGGGNTSGSFDYKSKCSSVSFPDPIPDELKTSIDEILQNNANDLVANVVCPLINGVVQAYNLSHSGGGSIPSFP